MLNLGVVNQGSSFAIPIPTRDGSGGAVAPSASFVDGDFLFYKDGATAAATIDAAATTPSTSIDSNAGVNQLLVDLSADSDFTEGSSWTVWLVPSSTTVDSQALAECVAVFTVESDGQKAARLAQEATLHATTIATLTDQTHFTLTDGNTSDDDVYQGMPVAFRDSATFAQKAAGIVSGYTASTKSITLEAAPGYTIAAGDYVVIQILPQGLTAQQRADVNAEADTALGDYAPAQAGDQMDLVNAPNATALAAILAVFNDLSIADIRTAVGLASANLDTQLSGLSTLDAAAVRTAIGLAAANLDTQLAALPTASEISTQVATDAGTTPLEVNLKKINDVTLTGDGSATPFDVV